MLVTTWHTPSGWVVVRDALTMGPRRGEDTITPHTRPPADDDAEHLLVRTVRCIDGNVEVELVCEPVFDYGRVPAEWTLVGDDRHVADASGAEQTIRLQHRHGARHRGQPRPRPPRARARATSSTARCRGPRASPRRPTSTTPTRGWTRRRASGARGSPARGCPTTSGVTPIQRSALAIKGLTYMPTGATVAALTTSLPETPGGERNWDYRYTWMRDSTFTLQALHWLNLDWEADEFMQFIADLEPNEDGALQIMYGIDGRRDLTESTRDDLSGYAGARPVRIGNGAFDQRQNDVYGAALDSILLHTRRSQRLPRRLWPIVQAQAECATAVWREPDQGIWEARGDAAALRLVEAHVLGGAGPRGQAGRHRAASRDAQRDLGARPREEIKADILEHGVDARGVLRQHYATDALDASTLLAAIFGFLPARRRAPARERAGDRRRADRARLRAALHDRRDRRRAVGQGGHVPHLLVLARLGAGDHRRAPARARPHGAPAARGLAARACTPRSSTPTPAGTWATSRRRSRTSR